VTQHYPLFFMAIHTGLRAGELAGIQRGDIDFHGKYVVVQRSIDRVHRKAVPTKTKKSRVDLSDELIAVLKEHLRQQKEWWFAEGKPAGDAAVELLVLDQTARCPHLP
jgi:integrase